MKMSLNVFYLSHVILASMDDQASANDVVDTIEADHGVNDVDAGHSIAVSHNVSKITNVSVIIFRCSVLQLHRK